MPLAKPGYKYRYELPTPPHVPLGKRVKERLKYELGWFLKLPSLIVWSLANLHTIRWCKGCGGLRFTKVTYRDELHTHRIGGDFSRELQTRRVMRERVLMDRNPIYQNPEILTTREQYLETLKVRVCSAWSEHVISTDERFVEWTKNP